MPAAAACPRRRFLAAALLAVVAARVRAASTGPWLLAEDGEVLLQLHADTLQPLQRTRLPQRWIGLIGAGAQPLGLGADGTLQRLGATAAAPRATGPVAASADGRFVCAVEGDALQLRDASLAPLRRWPLPAPVAWLADLPQRRAFVLAFATRAELWQLAWDERTEDFYDGLVHDHRFGEGVPTRAFHNVRRMPLPEPLLDASADASQSELAGRGWVFNLDARRRARLQPLLAPPAPGAGAPLRLDGRPALALPVRGEPRVDLYRCDDWERVATVALPWPAQALRAHAAQAVLAAWSDDGRLALLHPARGELRGVDGLGRLRAPPRWRDDGSELWVPTVDGLCAVDAGAARLRRVQPLERLLALA